MKVHCTDKERCGTIEMRHLAGTTVFGDQYLSIRFDLLNVVDRMFQDVAADWLGDGIVDMIKDRFERGDVNMFWNMRKQ